jgi:hypothetical protein
MTQTKLTDTEEQALARIQKTPGGTLRRYVDPNGARQYRLVDEKINPIYNFPVKVIESLIAKGWLELMGEKPKVL